jgi:DNA-directed RNA polymerase sigma subunit (sigma70/sigma32)
LGSRQGAELKANVIPARLEGDLGRFLDQARQQPLLVAEEERELAVRWRDTKDPEAARRLVASHLRLVVKIVKPDGVAVPVSWDLHAPPSEGAQSHKTDV